jgi:hypothetical protein
MLVSAATHQPIILSAAQPLLGILFLLVGAGSALLNLSVSMKYRLITKLNAQIVTNLRDEFFKPN